MINGVVINSSLINETQIAPRDFAELDLNWVATRYQCILTGAVDSLPDLELPISSYQIRQTLSPVLNIALTVIVPGVDSLIDEITFRPGGDLRIFRIYDYLDGGSAIFEMVTAPFERMDMNAGGHSGITGTLYGYVQPYATSRQTIELFDVITRSVENGRRRFRCRIDPRVKPNDIVHIGGESFTVDSILHIVDVKTAIMEVQELISG